MSIQRDNAENSSDNSAPAPTPAADGNGGKRGNGQDLLSLPPAEPIKKPDEFNLDRFRSKRKPGIANVATLLNALPVHNLAAAKDFVRLHPDEARYWTDEYCFVHVPIPGQKGDNLHLIDDDLAAQHLEDNKILRFRLALAAKPHDVFFLCQVPTHNLDNKWNSTNLDGCEQAKTRWVQLASRKGEGIEEYKISYARDADAFPEPNWPPQSIDELVSRTFAGRMIMTDDHPALLRLVGAKPSLK
jgi:hypothetical protein